MLRALVKVLMYKISCNVIDVINIIKFYVVIISDATNEFLPGHNTDLLN